MAGGVDGLLTQGTSSVPGRVDERARAGSLKVVVCLRSGLLVAFWSGADSPGGGQGLEGLRHSTRDTPRSDGPGFEKGELGLIVRYTDETDSVVHSGCSGPCAG